MGIACRNKDKQTPGKAENSIDAARNFIRAALDGKFDQARNYLLPDTVNISYMDVAERSYQRAEQPTRDGYRSASINIIRVMNLLKDSVTVIIYSNSFKNDHDTLKIVKVNNQWLVDLKYLYQHDADTLGHKELINDKIK